MGETAAGDGVLGRPLALPCGAVLPNRLAKAAMTEGLADALDRPTSAHETLYRRWGEGGAGLLVTGNVMVDRRFLERPGNVVVDGAGDEVRLRAWAGAGTAAGNHLWMQLSHPGRQCSRTTTSRPLAPSAVQLKIVGLFGRPRALERAEIRDLVGAYARTAEIARQTGFTGVQIHGAHGYLISQFLSPVTNRRRDEWGGPLENRARFLLEVVRAVRRAVGVDYPVSVKLNSADFQKGGFSLDECVRLVRWLDEEGVDLLEVSGGTYEQPRLLGHRGDADSYAEPVLASTRRREAYFLEYAREIRGGTRMPLMVTGGFRTGRAMAAAVETGEADVIGLGRPLCVDPDLPARLLDGSAEAGESWEGSLRLGPGRLLGPASPVQLFKFLNIQGQMAWFYRQLVALSRGEAADRALSLHRALARHFASELALARARRRVGARAGARVL